MTGSYGLTTAPTLPLSAVTAASTGICRIGAGVRSPEAGLRASAEHELAFIIRGRIRIDTANATFEAQSGDIVTTSPAEPHSTTALEDTEIFFVLLNPH